MIATETLQNQRALLLRGRGGYESPQTLRLLRVQGGSVADAFREVHDYGKDRWALIHDAGYPVNDMVQFMRNGYWSITDDHDISDYALPEHIQTPYGRLFWAGYSLKELRSVGFKGEIEPDRLSYLEKERENLRTSRKVFWGY